MSSETTKLARNGEQLYNAFNHGWPWQAATTEPWQAATTDKDEFTEATKQTKTKGQNF